MTDFDKISAMLLSAGQKYEVFENEDLLWITAEGGYSGFYSKITFTKDGTFVKIVAYK
jgi:hypothetical protein